MEYQKNIEPQFLIDSLIEKYLPLEVCKKDVEKACSQVVNCYKASGKLLICGNGGSSSDADHMVGELMKSFSKERKIDEGLEENLINAGERGRYIARNLQGALPAISLTAHTGLVSAISNDIDANLAFAQQIAGYGKKGDILVAISTSGNSRNVLDACIAARANGMFVIGLTGESGGDMNELCDITIKVPVTSTPDIQELHLPVYHTICQYVEHSLF
ncbi:MAG: SIS domain-containing protein [Bacteroidota bacterium]